jgi:hypothetical protein
LPRREKVQAVVEGTKAKKTPILPPVYGRIPMYKKIIKIFARMG